jgi:hypothetical protein
LLSDMTPLQAERLRQLLATICVDGEPRIHHGHVEKNDD